MQILRTSSASRGARRQVGPLRHGGARTLAVLAVLGMLVAACGGSGGRKTAAKGGEDAPTTSTVDVGASTTVASSDAQASPTSSSTVQQGVVSKTTATTKPRATAGKATVPTQPKAPVAGISQLVSPTTVPNNGPQPIPGGTLTYLIQNDLRATFDPASMFAFSSLGEGPAGFALYDALLTIDPPTLNLVPGTATAFTSTDGQTWTVKLRGGIRFSDGTPYDAAAVKFNWERIAGNPSLGSPSLAQAQELQSIDVVDPTTLRVVLKLPNGQWPKTVADRLSYIGSPKALTSGVDFSKNPVGAGPFLLKQYVRGSSMTFARNPDYWNAPRPYLDQLVIRPIVDDQQRYNTFITGGGQLTFTSEMQTVDQANKAGYSIVRSPQNGGWILMFNFAKPPFNDPRARRAVELAIDTNQLLSIENNLRRGARTLFDPGSPFYDQSLTYPAPDPSQAQTLLDQIAADNGGKPLTFTLKDPPAMKVYAEAIQAQLSKLKNISVDLQNNSSAANSSQVTSRDFTAAIYAAPFLDPDPLAYSYYLTGSPASYDGYSNPDLDKAITLAHTTLDANTRIAAWKTAQQILIKDWPELFLIRSEYVNYFDAKSLGGISFFENGVPRFDQMWLTK